eukprot:8456880-Pyramimonas_sp.AAC.1
MAGEKPSRPPESALTVLCDCLYRTAPGVAGGGARGGDGGRETFQAAEAGAGAGDRLQQHRGEQHHGRAAQARRARAAGGQRARHGRAHAAGNSRPPLDPR